MNACSEFKLMPLRETAPKKPLGDCPEKIIEYFHASVKDSVAYRHDVENCVIVFLNTRKRITGHVCVSTGTLDTLLMHPREVFKSAILANAAAIVLVHNHPSGDPTPSEADVKATRDMVRGGQILKIEVVDHVIVGQADYAGPDSKGWVSLRELGYFCA